MDVIVLEELTKTFGSNRAVDGLLLRVPAGSVYGFIGPNGSGKTTTLRMIMMSVPGMIQSVMEEKTQRIAEVLLGSISPFELMMGKLFSGMGIALTSSIVYIVGAVAVIRHLGYQSCVPYHILPWFFVYPLLAIVMQGALAATVGSVWHPTKP